MSSENKKRIRVPTEFAEASWGTLFQDLEIELVDSALEQTEENQCDFEITESMLPEKLLCENIKVHGLLSEYFSAGQNFDLVETLCADDKELFNIKIHDYLNLGHFIDAIVVEAYKQEFPVDKIRSFLNSILNYSFQLLHSEKELAPIEISFGGSDVGFAIQVSMTAKNFKIEKDWYRACNFIDACDYQKKSRVVVSALWFKGEDELKNLHFYFRKKQANLKNSKLANLTAVPLLSPAQVPYDPIFEDEDDKVVSGGIDENENAIRINGSRNNSNDVTIIKGSKEDLGAGTMKISGSMTVPQMEQQMLRMRSLMLKMKEQLKTQKPESAGGDGFDQELLSQVARLETKAAKLDEEKRSLNARLQLANRKLLIMDNNIQAREQLGRPSQEQALEQEVELLKQQKIVLESKLAAAAATPAPIPVTVQAAHNPVIELLNKDLATKEMDLLKLTEVKILYENKMKEYVAEIKKLDAKSKAQAVQLDSVLKKIAGSPAPGARNSENHSKQLEQASIRVAETTKELNDKKKEVIQLKQENSKLASKIADLEKKIAHFGKKVA